MNSFVNTYFHIIFLCSSLIAKHVLETYNFDPPPKKKLEMILLFFCGGGRGCTHLFPLLTDARVLKMARHNELLHFLNAVYTYSHCMLINGTKPQRGWGSFTQVHTYNFTGYNVSSLALCV